MASLVVWSTKIAKKNSEEDYARSELQISIAPFTLEFEYLRFELYAMLMEKRKI